MKCDSPGLLRGEPTLLMTARHSRAVEGRSRSELVSGLDTGASRARSTSRRFGLSSLDFDPPLFYIAKLGGERPCGTACWV